MEKAVRYPLKEYLHASFLLPSHWPELPTQKTFGFVLVGA